MHRIDSVGATVDNKFTIGNPSLGVPATVLDADWPNAVQEEICAVIEGAGITLVKGTNTQLNAAITAKISTAVGSLVTGPSSVTDGRVTVFDGTTGKLVKQGTKLEADLVTGPSSVTDGRVSVFDGTTGKLVKQGTKLEADLVTGPASATDRALALFNGAGGKIVQNSGITVDVSNNLTSPGSGSFAGLTFTGGSAGNLSIWANSGVLRLRGGASGMAFDNTSGTEIGTLTNGGQLSLADCLASRGSTNVTTPAVSTGYYMRDTIRALGPNASTRGTWSIEVAKSDDTDRLAGLAVSNTGMVTIGGGAGTAGTHTLNGRLTLANGSTGASLSIYASANALRFRTGTGGLIVDNTSSTDVFSITDAGNSGFFAAGGGNGTVRIQSGATTASSANPVLVLQYNADADCSGGYFVDIRNSGGSTIGSIRATSNTSVAYDTSSDKRWKKDEKDFSGLALVKQMDPKEYEWIDSAGTREIGLYAQDLYKILPHVVKVGNDEKNPGNGKLKTPWGVDYGRLTPVLVKAIKEQQEMIETLQKEVSKLSA